MNSYSVHDNNRSKYLTTRVRWIILFSIVMLLLVGGLAAWLILKMDANSTTRPTLVPSQTSDMPQPDLDPAPTYSPVDLQPVISEWVDARTATYSIVVYDSQAGKIIGSNLSQRQYFAASLYKLFVAYLALIDFQNGAQAPDEVIISGNTRKQCVDRMIRESYSPCGEAMMADMRQAALGNRVKAIGINNTSFTNITTTAKDVALLLQYILDKKHIGSENTAFLLNAMRIQEQRFRNGLAKGAPEATWETKVGWNGDFNYHDAGIMTMPDGRQFIVSILSQNNGRSAPIADFATTIFEALSR